MSIQVPDNQSSTSVKPSYAQACNPMEKIVVKRKDPIQVRVFIKSDIKQSLNLVNLDIRIGRIEHIRDGGIVLGCPQNDELS